MHIFDQVCAASQDSLEATEEVCIPALSVVVQFGAYPYVACQFRATVIQNNSDLMEIEASGYMLSDHGLNAAKVRCNSQCRGALAVAATIRMVSEPRRGLQ